MIKLKIHRSHRELEKNNVYNKLKYDLSLYLYFSSSSQSKKSFVKTTRFAFFLTVEFELSEGNAAEARKYIEKLRALVDELDAICERKKAAVGAEVDG